MPKKVDYPRAALSKGVELATAAYDLGGSSTIEILAEHMNRSVSGGFRDIISASVKYGLVKNHRGTIQVRQLFKDYHLGYSEEEKSDILQIAFLNVPLFKEIYDRFHTQKLPVQILDRLMIREFGVPPAMASRVSKYFIEGAKATGLMGSDNTFAEQKEVSDDPNVDDVTHEEESALVQDDVIEMDTDCFVVRITGPGINSTIQINEEEDLEIVQITLKKVKKKIENIK